MIEFIETKTYISFIGFVFLWMISPGPGHLLMLANGAKYGMPNSLLTAVGDISVNMLQMVTAALGIGALIRSFPWSFIILKWVGVIYLFVIAMVTLLSIGKKKIKKTTKNKSSLFMQGVVVTVTNPRAVFFFSALFPPFLVSKFSLIPQLIVLGICFVAVDFFFLTSYGLIGNYGVSKLPPDKKYYVDLFSGIMLIVALILLIFRNLEPTI